MRKRPLELVEPTFVLRASDPLAPSLLRQWARRHEIALNKGYFYLNNGGREEVERARQLAIDMEIWAQQDAVRKAREIMSRVHSGPSAQVIRLRKPQ